MILRKRLSEPTGYLNFLLFLIPLWIFLLNALSIFDAQIRSVSSSQRALSWTVLFPLCIFFLALHMYCWRGYEGKRRKYFCAMATVLFLLLVLFGVVFLRLDQPYPPIDMKLWFEISTGLFFVLFFIHSISYESLDTTAAIFLIGLLYGIILENGGIVLGFFRETGFHIYISFLPAPLFTSLGWCNVFYICRFCAHLISGRKTSDERMPQERGSLMSRDVLSFALIVTISALFLDIQLDPFATHHRLWVWNEELNPFFGGVPFINFSAWLSAVFPFAFAFRSLERRKNDSGKLFSIKLLISLPLVLMAAIFLVLSLTLICEGYASVSMRMFLVAGSFL